MNMEKFFKLIKKYMNIMKQNFFVEKELYYLILVSCSLLLLLLL